MRAKRVAMIGLDTSHTVEFTKLIQSPDPGIRVAEGMCVTTALRFPSVFQTEEGQDKREAELKALGVTMVPTLEAAVADVDAIFLEINDPALHLQYFEAAAQRGLPVFIDKPLAATSADGRRIRALAEEKGIPVWSASSLRYLPALAEACAAIPEPTVVHTFGALGKAADGSDLIWYGVHAVEMLVTALGTGAETVRAIDDAGGIVLIVCYGDGRRGLVECRRGFYSYGGRLQSRNGTAFFDSGQGSCYPALISALQDFVCRGIIPVPLAESQEVLAILEAGECSLASGQTEAINRQANNEAS